MKTAKLAFFPRYEYHVSLVLFLLTMVGVIVALFSGSLAHMSNNPDIDTTRPYVLGVMIGSLGALAGGMGCFINYLSDTYGEPLRYSCWGMSAGMIIYTIAELFGSASIIQWVIFLAVSGSAFMIGFILSKKVLEEHETQSEG